MLTLLTWTAVAGAILFGGRIALQLTEERCIDRWLAELSGKAREELSPAALSLLTEEILLIRELEPRLTAEGVPSRMSRITMKREVVETLAGYVFLHRHGSRIQRFLS